MNYKALEDLVNILVKKAGFELGIQVVSHEVTRLEEKKSKLNTEKEKFLSSIENKTYISVLDKEKDEIERDYLRKRLNELEKELTKLKKDLDSFDKVLEGGETYYDSLVNELENLKETKEKLVKQGEDEAQIDKSIKDKEIQLLRKRLLNEEIKELENEISKTKEELKVLSNKIEMSSYQDDLSKEVDNNILLNYEQELRIINDALYLWNNSPEIIGAKILDAFKDNKSVDSVSYEIDALVKMANAELKKTQEEVNGANIFEVMDKYETLVIELKDKLGSETYLSRKEEELVSTREAYHKDKINKHKNTLDGINVRKEEVLNLISVSKNLCEDAKTSRLDLERKLNALESKLFISNTQSIETEELKQIDKIIGEIKSDINRNQLLENEYLNDIYSYKAELKNLDVNYNTLTLEIENEEKILDMIRSKLDKNGICVDNIQVLEDRISIIENENRLASLKNQQQYLYVDTKVIKDEIYALWKRASGTIVEEKKEEEKIELQKTEEVIEKPVEEEKEEVEDLFEIIDDKDTSEVAIETPSLEELEETVEEPIDEGFEILEDFE